MRLVINEDYMITSDSMQYILQERKVVVEGDNKDKEYWVNVSYHRQLTSVLQSYKDLQIRNSDVTTIDELMRFVKALDKKIETLLEGI